MPILVQVVIAGAAIVAAAALVGLVFELRGLRALIRAGLNVEVTRFPTRESIGSQSARPGRPRYGYAIYVYRDAKWVLDQDLSGPGRRAVPPRLEGAYEGQALRVASVAEAVR